MSFTTLFIHIFNNLFSLHFLFVFPFTPCSCFVPISLVSINTCHSSHFLGKIYFHLFLNSLKCFCFAGPVDIVDRVTGHLKLY